MVRRVLLLAFLLPVATAATASEPQPRETRASLVAQWQAQGLQVQPARGLDLLYVGSRAGAAGQGLQVAPVRVELRRDWQLASRGLERARLRPAEVQRLKDEVAAIVADELRRELADVRAGGVLEARVLDLYLNAPELQTAAMTRTYTRSFGDMVLVAELRDGHGGPLLLASWDHAPAREHATLRRTTRVENAIELRAAAHAWARQLRREFDRLAGGG